MKKINLAFTSLLSLVLSMCTSQNESNQLRDDNSSDSHIEVVSKIPGSTIQINRGLTDSSENKLYRGFEKIEVASIPNYDSLMHILELANLDSLCDDQDVDLLDIDLMFMKTGANSFDQFKLIKLTDGTDRSFTELFPEEDLINFYTEASSFLNRDK
ncbi:MAG: hypothetical protein ACI9O4_000520 [Chitinophagales bacterium]|jgi:hypothetical protein